MALSSNLGFPRFGSNRQLKHLLESYWNGELEQEALLKGLKNLRIEHWQLQKSLGVDHIPSNDFSLYDHVLDTAVTFGVIPERFQHFPAGIERYMAMSRGAKDPQEGVDVWPLEMKKWFDTNYHYMVPEFRRNEEFFLAQNPALEYYKEAKKECGLETRPVLLGPVTFLSLGKPAKVRFDLQ